MGPEFIASLSAKTALETPQILLEWEFGDVETPMCSGVAYKWDNVVIRRGDFRFPEDPTEGTSILSEAYSSSPTVNLSDIDSLDGMREYYYSLYLQYTEHSTSLIDLNQDIGRLGAVTACCAYDQPEAFLSGIDGQTTASQPTFDSAGSTFRTDGVSAGDILEIDEGAADDGFYTIISVNSETQVTLDSNLTLTTSNVDFNVYPGHPKFWFGGFDFKRRPVLWRWDATTQLIDYKIDLSILLGVDEYPIGIALADQISGTKYIAFISQTDYIRIPIMEEPQVEDIIESFDAASKLTAGGELAGAFYYNSNVYLLDTANYEIRVVVESTGVVSATKYLNAIDGLAGKRLYGLSRDGVNGLIYFGAANYILGYDEAQASPTSAHVEKLVYVRDLLRGSPAFYTELLSQTDYLCLVNDSPDVARFQTYSPEDSREYLWQQPYVADWETIALYHLDETSGDPVDSSARGNDATNNGMTPGEDARFATGFEADAVTEYIDLTGGGGNTFTTDFDGAEGSASLWFKASAAAQLTSGSSVMLVIEVNASNLVKIQIASGQLTFTYVAGGTTETIADDHPNADTEPHHYLITWSKTADKVEAFVDGVQFGTAQTGLGTWAGTVATARIGDGTATTLGVYDETMISTKARTVHAAVQSYTDANKMYAFSGRDYDATYETGERLGFHYRDHVFTEKLHGGDFIIRNDYEKSKLHPPNKVVASTQEIIFRGPDPLPELGDVGRLSRLVGLFLDRVADSREQLMELYDFLKIDYDSIPPLAKQLGIPGLDFVNWNVDMQRRYLYLMSYILRRRGRSRTYLNYARLLGFTAKGYTLHARRRLDSVHYNATYDSRVSAIYLDEMGSLDTADEYFPLALLRWRFYKRSTKGITGATSATPSDRLLTDASATFTTTCLPGSMIQVNDIDDTEDNGYYLVEEVRSDTVIKVDQDWPTGGLTGLTYYNSWEVPEPDPYVDYLLERFKGIAPASMKTMHRDGSL